jgi:hypothetical protein
MRALLAFLFLTCALGAAEESTTEHATPQDVSHVRERIAREEPNLINVISPCFEGRCTNAACRETDSDSEEISTPTEDGSN